MYSIRNILFFCFLSLFTSLSGEEVIKPIARSNHLFSFSLFDKLDSSGKNIIFSPFSISSCLYMTYVGSEGLTEYEMKKILGLNVSQYKLPDLYRKTYQALTQPHKIKSKKNLFLANSLWVDKNMPILPSYRFMIEKNFYGTTENIDFSNPNNATHQINDWVGQNTGKKINDFLKDGDISSATKLLLVNATYFKGNWQSPFSKELTYMDKFYLNSEGSTTHVLMMHKTEKVPFFENDIFKGVMLPFSDRQIPPSMQMICFVPKTFGQRFSYHDLYDFITHKKEQFVDLSLPIFSINSSQSIKKELIQLGMIKAFSSLANFSKITGKDELYVADVFHACDFSLDEAGVEAAAASGASMNLKSIGQKAEKTFEANKPFMFMIYDMDQNLILFMGSIKIPREG